MSTMKKSTGVALATAAAALFAMTPVSGVQAAEGNVPCLGINACKGQGACHTAENACAGQNACKGQGMTPVASEEECIAQGGTVIPGH